LIHRKKFNFLPKKLPYLVDRVIFYFGQRKETNFLLKRTHGFSNHTGVVYECPQYQSIPHMDNIFSLIKPRKEVPALR
jgi:hypothetical protein